MPNGKEDPSKVELPSAGSVPSLALESGKIDPEVSGVVGEGIPGVTGEAEVNPNAVNALAEEAGIGSDGETSPAGAPEKAAEAVLVAEAEAKRPAWQTIIEEAKEKITAEKAKSPEEPTEESDIKRAGILSFALTQLDAFQRYFEQKPEIDKQLAMVGKEIEAATKAYNEAIDKNDAIATQQALATIEEKQKAKETVLAGIPQALKEGKVIGEWPDDIKAILQEAVDQLRPLMMELTPEQLLEKGQRVFQRLYDEAANKGVELEKAEQILGELLKKEGLTNEQYARYLEEQGKAIQEKLGGKTGDITKLTPFERRFWWEQIVNITGEDITRNLEEIKDANKWPDNEVIALYEALPEWVRNQDDYAPLRERKEKIDLLANRESWTIEDIQRAQVLGIELTDEEKAKLTPPPPPEFTQEEFEEKRRAGTALTADELEKALNKKWLEPKDLTPEEKERLKQAGKDLASLGIEEASETPEAEGRWERFKKDLREKVDAVIEVFKKDKKGFAITAFAGLLTGAIPGAGVGAAAGYLAATITGPFGWITATAVGIGGFALKKYLEKRYLNPFLEKKFTERAEKIEDYQEKLNTIISSPKSEEDKKKEESKLNERVEKDVNGYFAIHATTQAVGYALSSAIVSSVVKGAVVSHKAEAAIKRAQEISQIQAQGEGVSQQYQGGGLSKLGEKVPSSSTGGGTEIPTTGRAPWVEERITHEILTQPQVQPQISPTGAEGGLTPSGGISGAGLTPEQIAEAARRMPEIVSGSGVPEGMSQAVNIESLGGLKIQGAKTLWGSIKETLLNYAQGQGISVYDINPGITNVDWATDALWKMVSQSTGGQIPPDWAGKSLLEILGNDPDKLKWILRGLTAGSPEKSLDIYWAFKRAVLGG